MSARLRALLALVLSLALLDAGLAWLDRRSEERHEAHPGDALVAFEPAGIARIVLTRAGKKPLVVARSPGGGWAVASAKNFPARAAKVEQILQRIRGWKRERVAGEKAQHDTFAVTKEKGVSVRLEDFSGQTVASLIMGSITGLDPEAARTRGGNVDTSQLGRYMRVASEDQVFVVSDFVTGELEPEPVEWLERPIVSGDEAKAKALVVKKRTGEQLAVLFDAPYPRLATQDQRPVDAERAKPLLRAVLQANATDTLDEDEAKLGLQPPQLTAEVLFADGSPPARLLLGELQPGSPTAAASYAAKVPDKPGPLLVPQAAVAQLFSATAESLVLAHAFGEKPGSSITRASLHEGDRTTTLARGADGKWTVSAVGSGTSAAPRTLDAASDAKRKRALDAIAHLATLDFDPRGLMAHGLARPGATLSIEMGKERFELLLGQEEGPAVWARRQDLPCALALRADAVVELRSAFQDLAR